VKPEAVFTPKARREVTEIAKYLGFTAGRRFRDAIRKDSETLAQWPGFGTLREFENPLLAGVRSWRVSKFKNYLIFFRPIEGGVEILHISHGARDIERLFDE